MDTLIPLYLNVEGEKKTSRAQARQPKIRKEIEIIPCVLTYNDWHDEIGKIVRRHWSILRDSYKNILEFNPLLSFRRSQNVGNVGSRHKLHQSFLTQSRSGCFPCLACVNCKYMKKGEYFIHPLTGYRHHIISKNYLKIRMNQHRYSISKGRMDLPVPKHFCIAGHTEKNLKFMIIDHVPVDRRGGDMVLK